MSDENQSTPPEPEKLVSSVLYTQGTAEIKKKVADELKVPDPPQEQAEAALEKFTEE